jgi:hypothetical protein
VGGPYPERCRRAIPSVGWSDEAPETCHSCESNSRLGISGVGLVGIGLVLLAGTLLYIFPGTSILGAVLLTGYLGGAIASQVRVQAS